MTARVSFGRVWGEIGSDGVATEIRVEAKAVGVWNGEVTWSGWWKDREVKSFNSEGAWVKKSFCNQVTFQKDVIFSIVKVGKVRIIKYLFDL